MRAPGGPRLLLRRLREVMAEPVTAQARLDRIVVLIASIAIGTVLVRHITAALQGEPIPYTSEQFLGK